MRMDLGGLYKDTRCRLRMSSLNLLLESSFFRYSFNSGRRTTRRPVQSPKYDLDATVVPAQIHA